MIVSLMNFALYYEYSENEKTNVCNASLIKPIYLSDKYTSISECKHNNLCTYEYSNS